MKYFHVNSQCEADITRENVEIGIYLAMFIH